MNDVQNDTNGHSTNDESMKTNNQNHDEYQYLNLVRQILKNGSKKEDRTGTATLE